MFRAIAGALAVHSLRARDNDFFNRQVFFADDFENLRSAERINMHKFRNLWHVTAVGGLVKNGVYFVESGNNRVAIAQIALYEFRFLVDPSRLSAAMRLWFQIIERPNLPASIHEKIDYM